MKEFISKYKGYVIIAVIFVIYISLSLFFSGLSLNLSNHYIAVSDNIFWKFERGKWYNMDLYNFSKIDLSNFSVFNPADSSYIGNYSLKYKDDVWNISSDGKSYEKNEYFLFAYRGNKKFKMITFNYEQFNENDYEIIKRVVGENGYSFTKELNSAQKVVMDLDKDKKEETIYIISNMFTNNDPQFCYSMVFVYKNNNYQVLGVDTYKSPAVISKKKQYSLYSIIDLTGDGKYEIILENQPFSNPKDSVFDMYEYQKNKYVKIITSRQG